MIEAITIENVKGIVSQDVKVRAFPNVETYVVAPNGTGKSSLATAFAHLGKNGIKLEDSECRDGDPSNLPMVRVSFGDGSSFEADSTRNDFYGKCGVAVINSGIFAKQSVRQFGGHSTASAYIAVPEVQLAKKKPLRVEVKYSIREVRKGFPSALSGLLTNYKDDFSNAAFVGALAACPECFRPTTGPGYLRAVDAALKEAVVSEVGEWANAAPVDLEKVKPLKAMVGKLPFLRARGASNGTYLDALQLNRFCCDRKKDIAETAKWLEYRDLKSSADELISAIDTTGAGIRTHERKGVLLVEFPLASRMSNGERDVMQFAMQLIRAGVELARYDRAILIVDDVLDYLDDANLMVAHYYIGKMADSFKRSGKELYIFLLTHLDPHALSSYRRPCRHVAYFGRPGEGDEGKISGPMRKLLVDRKRCKKEEKRVYDEVSSLYLHYSDGSRTPSAETVAYLKGKGLSDEESKPEGFARAAGESLDAYLRGGGYDSAMVCCAIRRAVEEHALHLLDAGLAADMLDIDKGTELRLIFAEEHGAAVPDIFHMLGELYNDCMHLSGESNQEVLIYRKLGNKVIRRMVAEVAAICGCWGLAVAENERAASAAEAAHEEGDAIKGAVEAFVAEFEDLKVSSLVSSIPT